MYTFIVIFWDGVIANVDTQDAKQALIRACDEHDRLDNEVIGLTRIPA